MTLHAWIAYIDLIHTKAIDMGLERADRVRRALGLAPSCPLITVGGTNGKGSTCAFLEAILTAAGYRTGVYTSPHLLRVNERIHIGGQEIEDSDFCAALAQVEAARGQVPLTYFEFMTLAAMVAFGNARVDVAILEVGMGGRLDAVNVFDADCAIITSIDLDHTEYLGSDREAIAREKVGIFRPGAAAICGDATPPAAVVEYAGRIGAGLRQTGRDYGFYMRADDWEYWEAGGLRLTLPAPGLHGSFQLTNASCAVAALQSLKSMLDVGDEAVRQGLQSAMLPGRFEVWRGSPTVILDVAHNPQAVVNLAVNLNKRPCAGKTTAVFGIMADKDIAGVIQAVRGCVDRWFVCDLPPSRAARSNRLRVELECLDSDVMITEFTSVEDAYLDALASSSPNDRVVVFGSFVTVTEVMLASQRMSNDGAGRVITL